MSQMDSIFSICLQGDVNRAYRELRNLEPKTKTIMNWEKRFFDRFYSNSPALRIATDDRWIRNVIHTYVSYFISVLTQQNTYEEAESILARALRSLLHGEVTNSQSTLDEIENQLEKQFNAKGYYFLGGYVGPSRGPFIWRRMERKEYAVALPGHIQNVTVYFMHDFLLSSWLHFATFGKRSAGGWAKEDGLYCVYDRYKSEMENDSFLVSYLKHEAQHISDYQRYPELTGTQLEYRAKLIELVYYSSHKRLETFLSDAQADSDHPHPLASFQVMDDLSQYIFKERFVSDRIRWKAIPYKTVQQAALELHREHTKQLTTNRHV